MRNIKTQTKFGYWLLALLVSHLVTIVWYLICIPSLASSLVSLASNLGIDFLQPKSIEMLVFSDHNRKRNVDISFRMLSWRKKKKKKVLKMGTKTFYSKKLGDWKSILIIKDSNIAPVHSDATLRSVAILSNTPLKEV